MELKDFTANELINRYIDVKTFADRYYTEMKQIEREMQRRYEEFNKKIKSEMGN